MSGRVGWEFSERIPMLEEMMMNFQDVVVNNRALLARARQLNVRAGSEVFLIPSRQDIAEAVKTVLGGARCVTEISNVTDLLLPALNEKLVAKVLNESPDTINILGKEVVVEYRSGYAPRVRLDFHGDESRNWLKLPDDSIRLPNGREVSICSVIEGCGHYIESTSSQFKAKAREGLNQGLWDKWQKPELPTPTESIPAIVEMVYGRCVVTDAPLLAYGTVNYDSYYGSWKSHWSRDRAESERLHAQVCEKFVAVKEKIVLDGLRRSVSALHRAHYYNQELSEKIRIRMSNTHYGHPEGAITVSEIKALIAEVEVAVEAIEARKAEVKRKQREAEARREAVEHALRIIGSAQAYVWVPKNGEVAYVLGGKTSMMGRFVVFPKADHLDISCGGRPYCFGDFKYQAWVAFKFDVVSKAQDYSGSGTLQSEVALFLTKGLLSAGVYGVGADDEGQFFFPVIHHNANYEEVIPEISAVRKIRVPKESSKLLANSGAGVDLKKIDFSQLFGGAAKVR